MSDSPYDLRDYLFGELTPEQRREVERYLKTSSEAREELEQLKTTESALLSIPDEEVPRRIAFVSDKVFEPSLSLRLWRDFWGAAPRLAFRAGGDLARDVCRGSGGSSLRSPWIATDGL